MALTKRERRIRIRHRIRQRLSGNDNRPRMSVYRSNKEIYVQLINDVDGKTLLATSSREKEIAEVKNINKTEQAKLVGKLFAQKALSKGVSEVLFDRGGYLYHGRVKSLAEAARENGLKF